jgi:hypothetical protein
MTDLPCREELARGQKAVRVWGPGGEVAHELLPLHQAFWLGTKVSR